MLSYIPFTLKLPGLLPIFQEVHYPKGHQGPWNPQNGFGLKGFKDPRPSCGGTGSCIEGIITLMVA